MRIDHLLSVFGLASHTILCSCYLARKDVVRVRINANQEGENFHLAERSAPFSHANQDSLHNVYCLQQFTILPIPIDDFVPNHLGQVQEPLKVSGCVIDHLQSAEKLLNHLTQQLSLGSLGGELIEVDIIDAVVSLTLLLLQQLASLGVLGIFCQPTEVLRLFVGVDVVRHVKPAALASCAAFPWYAPARLTSTFLDFSAIAGLLVC